MANTVKPYGISMFPQIKQVANICLGDQPTWIQNIKQV